MNRRETYRSVFRDLRSSIPATMAEWIRRADLPGIISAIEHGHVPEGCAEGWIVLTAATNKPIAVLMLEHDSPSKAKEWARQWLQPIDSQPAE